MTSSLGRSSLRSAGDGPRASSTSRADREAWEATPLRRRLAIVRRTRHLIAENLEQLADTVQAPWRSSRTETISAEILPLADACRFLEREAGKLLAEQNLGRRGRPFWLAGSGVCLRREPWGVVLIVGPSNYPLMLSGIQTLQALVAGNAVLLKPGRGGKLAALALQRMLVRAGLPPSLLTVLEETPAAARAAIRGGVDRVVLTGALETGRSVMQLLAAGPVPATLELSGCDAVFVRQDADVNLVARALRFGLTFNGGFSCIAPRRVFVARSLERKLESRLAELFKDADPISLDERTAGEVQRLASDALRRGARWVVGGAPGDGAMRLSVLAEVGPEAAIAHADIAAPLIALIPVDGDDHALELAARCDYALGATVFGSSDAAQALARRIRAGVVVINDMLVPTADPRVPFGGRGASGFGVTRGAEGLLQMTQPKALIQRRGGYLPHLEPLGPTEERLLPEFVRLAHAPRLRQRARALFEVLKIRPARDDRTSEVTMTALNETNDRIGVIGGGLGGLAAACTLAARGHRVTLFEKNAWLGGKAAVLEDGGYRFDMGPTILTVPRVLRRIFAEAGRDLDRELELIRLDPQWRCFFEDGSVLDLQENVDEMAGALERFAPDRNSGDGYRELLRISEQLHEISERFFFWKSVEDIRDTLDLRGSFNASTLRDVMRIRMGGTVAGLIRRRVKDPRAAQMLDHFTQYVGSSPYNSPAVLCSIAHMQLDGGVWYPRGGTRAVPQRLAALARDLRVELRTGCGVRRILVEDGRATGVETDTGDRLAFGAVVSNMDSVRTYRELVGGREAKRFGKRRSYKPACSGVVLYLGLDRGYDHLLHHNFVFSRDPQEEFDRIYRLGQPAPDPTCYVAAPARTEPGVAPPGGEALYVLVHTPYLRPGHDWSKMLPGYRRVILDKLAGAAGMRDIESRIRVEHALTPQDIHERYRVLDGAIYGLASHGRFTGAFKPGNRSRDVRGLYLAGGAAHPGPGMPMVMMSGWIAADTLHRDRVGQTATPAPRLRAGAAV